MRDALRSLLYAIWCRLVLLKRKNPPSKSSRESQKKVHWSQVPIWSGTIGGRIQDPLKRHITLNIYRHKGRPSNTFFDDPAAYDFNGEALDGSGRRLEAAGPAADDIDWGGFRSEFPPRTRR